MSTGRLPLIGGGHQAPGRNRRSALALVWEETRNPFSSSPQIWITCPPENTKLAWLTDGFRQVSMSHCNKRGADVRPDFNWNKQPFDAMGYR
jgi:hypothetical protein